MVINMCLAWRNLTRVTYLSLVGRTIQGGGGGEGNLSHSKWKVGCSVKAYPSLELSFRLLRNLGFLAH